MLVIGLENNMSGAREAYDYLNPFLAERDHVFNMPDLAYRGGWAVALEGER